VQTKNRSLLRTPEEVIADEQWNSHRLSLGEPRNSDLKKQGGGDERKTNRKGKKSGERDIIRSSIKQGGGEA